MTRILACLIWMCSAYGAFAAGAIAVGEPADVAKEGLAFGIAVNQPTAVEAAAAALRACQSYKETPPTTNALCKVVRTFVGECVVTAYDPEPSTPGWGWGIGLTKFTAEDQAMQATRTTAGPERARFCAAATTKCDVKQGE